MKTFDFLFYQCMLHVRPAHPRQKNFYRRLSSLLLITEGGLLRQSEGSLLKILYPPAWRGGTSKSSQSQYFCSRYIIILFDILTTAGIKHDAEEARGRVGFLRHAYKAFLLFFLSILFFFCVRKAKRLDRITFFCKM
jgi:hypothetical protein